MWLDRMGVWEAMALLACSEVRRYGENSAVDSIPEIGPLKLISRDSRKSRQNGKKHGKLFVKIAKITARTRQLTTGSKTI